MWNAPEDVIVQRFMGNYDNGIGKRWQDPNLMKFYEDGKVSFPYLSDGMWFLTQHKRLGPAQERAGLPGHRQASEPDPRAVRTQAAAMAKVPVPKDPDAFFQADRRQGMGRDPKGFANNLPSKLDGRVRDDSIRHCDRRRQRRLHLGRRPGGSKPRQQPAARPAAEASPGI